MKKNLFGSLADIIKGNAVLIILSICVVAAGALSFYTVNDINNKLKNQQVKKSPQSSVTQSEDEAHIVQNEGEKVPLKPSATPSPEAKASPSPSPSASPEASSSDTQNTEGFILPVSGEIYAAFSKDELVYNKTLDDWRTHNGIDIKTSRDSAVKAGAAGVVKAVYTDGMLGTVVEIKTDDYVARYCGLNPNVMVKKGDGVEQGMTIGTVGEIALEVTDEAHLHLEIIKNGTSINPADMIK